MSSLVPAPKAPSTIRWSTKKEIDKDAYPLDTPELESMMLDDVGVGDLEMDLPEDFNEADMPTLVAAEEVIDEGLLDAEDGATEVTSNTSISRLKSQAQSTYMLEKHLEIANKPPRNRRSLEFRPLPFITTTAARASKAVKKDKAKPAVRRVTAYMLWARDQKNSFTEKYPHLDFSGASKKLGEGWSSVPQAQKKMWKNRAAKQMKSAGENIKNTAPPKPPPRVPKLTKRGLIRVTKPADSIEKNTKSIKNKNAVKAKGKKRKLSDTYGDNDNDVITPPKKKQQEILMPAKVSKMRGKAKGNLKLESNNLFGTTTHIVKNGRKPPAQNTGANLNVAAIRASTTVGKGGTKIQYSPRRDEEPMYKVTGTDANDAAAHFILLGESLQIIGQRLKEYEEGQTVSGSLSVLLDSLICATGPLLCLTQHVSELNVIPQETLSKTLNNIAYIMPGL